MIGTCKNWFDGRAFGFIAPDGGGDDILYTPPPFVTDDFLKSVIALF